MQRYKIYGKTGKWNRLIDAFSGKGTAFSMPEYPKVPFPEMIEELRALTEEDWGKYAFSREPLEGRFSNEQKMQYTHKRMIAVESGLKNREAVWNEKSERIS